MTKVLWTTQWIWEEVFEYSFDEPLPDNWAEMDNDERANFLSAFDCEKLDSQPIEPLHEHLDNDTFEVYE